MEGGRHKTLKRPSSAESAATTTTAAAPVTAAAPLPVATAASTATASAAVDPYDPFRNLLDESARDAFRRPWHRLERGLRLNRLRMYVEEMAPQCSFTAAEKADFFKFLSGALDRKLLNTHKIVDYVAELQRIKTIHGLEVRRMPDGTCKWGFVKKKEGTRRAPRKPIVVGGGAGAGAGAAAAAATTNDGKE
jgi:hypothetical protein